MVDIFEAGPVVIAERDQIRTLRESVRVTVEEISPGVNGSPMYVLNPKLDSRCGRAMVEILPSGNVRLDEAAAAALDLKPGQTVRVCGDAPTCQEQGLHDGRANSLLTANGSMPQGMAPTRTARPL